MIDFLYAQGGEPSSSPFMVFLPFVLVILIFYFLLIRPQAKRQKELERKRQELVKGSVFITSGGLYAKVNHFKNDGRIIVAEISKDVKVEVVRSTIMDIVDTPDNPSNEKMEQKKAPKKKSAGKAKK